MSDRTYSFEEAGPDDVPFASPEEAEEYMRMLLAPFVGEG